MNGFVDEKILNDESAVIMNRVAALENDTDRIEEIYLSIWNRYPRDSEARYFRSYIRENGSDAYKEILWAMVNSHEFLFIN